MQRPFIHPCAYSILILLSTAIIATAVFISLLLLFHYCYYYKTVTTDKLLRASLFSGAAELTTHLLKFINILWLPLCRINKFGFYFPRRLLQSPILVGYQILLQFILFRELYQSQVFILQAFIYQSLFLVHLCLSIRDTLRVASLV